MDQRRRGIIDALARWDRWAIAVLVVFLGGASAIIWSAKDVNLVTGDEPHYILVSKAIASGSLEISDTYASEFANPTVFGGVLAPPDAMPVAANTHGADGPRGLYSVHNIGLPVLIAAPYAIAGIVGVRAVMLIIAFIAVIALAVLVETFVTSRRERLIAVGVAATSAALIPHTNQVFPDVAGGACALVALAVLFHDERPDRWRWVALAAVAVMPWFHLKFTLPAALLVLALWWFDRKPGQGTRLAVVTIGPLAASGVLLAVYQWWAFGNPRGPYSEGALQIGAMPATVFAGLHFDQFHGLFVLNPSLVVGVAFAVPFARRFRWKAAVLGAVYLAFIVPNAMHPNWYGGYSFAGRFGVAGGMVLLPVAVFGLVQLLRSGWLGQIVVAAIAAYHLAQFGRYGILAVERYSDLALPPDAYPTNAPPMWRLLPLWYRSDWAFSYLPNLAFAAALVGIVIAGARSVRTLCFTAIGGVVLIVIVALVSSEPHDQFERAFWPLPLGDGPVGAVSYLTLGDGDYWVELDYVAAAGDEVGVWGLYYPFGGDSILVQSISSGAPGEPETQRIEFDVPAELERELVEVRVVPLSAEVATRSVTVGNG